MLSKYLSQVFLAAMKAGLREKTLFNFFCVQQHHENHIFC
jgi:hypothetical protein